MNEAQSAEPIAENLDRSELSRKKVGICIGLIAITFIVFGQTLHYPFIYYDDNVYVYENPVVAKGLTGDGICWAFGFHAYNWHPLTWLSHMMDCQIYGLNPGWHHLTNILLHTSTVVMLFLVLREMTGAFWRSAFVAAVFAIHPLRVESVAWVAERKDVLSGLFFMLTMGAYMGYVRKPRSVVRYGLVLLLFALGLMAKPMLVTLPFVLLLLDYWPLQRKESLRSLLLEKLPLLGLSAASCAVTLLAQRGVIRSVQAFSLPLRFGNALMSSMIYLRQMVFPSKLVVHYLLPQSLELWKPALAGVLLIGFSAIAWVNRRARPWLVVGWLWYLVMLIPVAGIIQVGAQAHADRYAYLPQIGIYIVLTWLVAELGLSCAVLAGVMTGVITIFSICAFDQTKYWRNTEVLADHAIAGAQDNPVPYIVLGGALLEKGQVDDAIDQYQKAVHINTNFAEAHYNLGTALDQKGRMHDAIAQFEQAVKIDPNYAEAHNNLGHALCRAGRVDEGIAQFEQALRIKPAFVEARNNLGNAYMESGQVEKAISCYKKVLEISPSYAPARDNLAKTVLQRR